MTEPTQRDKFCALLVDRRIERTLGREPLPRDDFAVWWGGKFSRCWGSRHLTKGAIRLRIQNRLRTKRVQQEPTK